MPQLWTRIGNSHMALNFKPLVNIGHGMGRFHKSHECWNTRPAASEDLCSRYPSMCHSLPVLKFYGNLVIYSHTARCAYKDPLIEFRKRRQVCLCVGPGTWNIWANVCNSAKTLTTLALK